MIRHAKTEANELMMFSGKTDVPITENGKALLGQKIAKNLFTPTELYYTSGMLRAMQTLEAIFGSVEYTPVASLAEYDFGDFEMKPNSELMQLQSYLDWRRDETGDLACPNGESKNAFRERVIAGYHWILDDASRKAAKSLTLVAHGGSISELYRYILNDYESHRFEVMPRHGEGYRFWADKGPGGWQVAKTERISEN